MAHIVRHFFICDLPSLFLLRHGLPASSVFTSALASRFCADTTLSVVTLPLLFAGMATG
jgi:hypothetical protein